jgi:hypothetical protein
MSHTNPAPRRTWPWVVVVLVVVVAIIVGASVISSVLAAPSAAPTSTPRATVQANASTPPTTPTESSTPTAAATHKTALTASDITAIEGAIEDNDATELYAYLSEPVHVAFAASDFHSDRSRDNAVTDLDYVNGTSGWNWKLDDATLAQFRAGAYGSSFPVGAIVGESAEGYVISFTVTKAKITAIFVSKTVALVTAASQ